MLVFLLFLSVTGTKPPSGRVSFCAVGDILLDRGVRNIIENKDFDYPFRNVRNIVDLHDLAFCNLECPITEKGNPIAKRFSFCADTSYVNGIVNSGFNIISVANNHTLDYGRTGFIRTSQLLSEKGLFSIGGGVNQKEARGATIITKNGLKFAFFGFIDMLPDGIVYIESEAGPAYASTEEIVRKIEKIRDKVDFVIVSFHWGSEFNRYPRIDHVEKAHRIIDAGADLILGHHPHVLQSVEIYKERPIIYSLGNFVFDQHKIKQCQSAIFECVFEKGKVDSISFIPVILEKSCPRIAEKKERKKIMNTIIDISNEFGTRFCEKNNKLFVKIDSSFSFTKPICRCENPEVRVSLSGDKMVLKDDFGKTLSFQDLPEGKDLKDCCFINDTSGLHLYGILGDEKSTFGERIVTATITDTGLIGPFIDPHTFYPWKIMKADVDGDSKLEICVGVWKRTKYDTVVSNRLFIYNRRGPYIYPKWLGSRVNSPLIDFDFRDFDSDSIDELITLELNEDGSKKINLYKWFEFGFDFIKTLKEKQEEGIISSN